MIRTLFKLALLIAVVAFFVPREDRDGRTAEPALSPVVLFYGATQALSDLGSFCDRSPAACASGREAAAYAGARIMDGVQVLVAMATGRSEPAEARPAAPVRSPVVAPPAETVSLRPTAPSERTGSIAPGPRPYQPPLLQPEPPVRRDAPTAPRRDAAPASPAATASRAPAATAPGRPAVTAPPRAATTRAAQAEPRAAVRPAGVPGADKPFRMPAMAGGAEPPVSPRPFALVPPPAPARPPMPLSAPRA
jgi:hypothetical protein